MLPTDGLPLSQSVTSSLGKTTGRVDQLSVADVVFALLGALLVLMPFVRFTGFANTYNSHRIASLAVLVVALVLACSPSGVRAVRGGLDLVGRWVTVGLLGIAALGLASAALAPSPLYGMAEVGQLTSLIILSLLLAGAWRGDPERAWKSVAWLAVAVATSYAGFILVQHVGELADGRLGWPKQARGAFGNRRFLNHAQLVMVPLLFGLSLQLGQEMGARAIRWGIRLVLSTHLALLIASGGRAAMLGFVIAGSVGIGLLWARRGDVLRDAILVIVGGLTIYGLLFTGLGPYEQFGGVTERTELAYSRPADVSNGRYDLWAAAARMVADKPLLGVGPMHFAYYSGRHSGSPHNVVLQFAAEWGVPATLILLGLALLGIKRWWIFIRKTAPESERYVRGVALKCAVVGTLVSSMFDGSLLIVPVAQVWLVLLLGLLVAHARQCGGDEMSLRATSSKGWSAGVLLAVALSLAPVITVSIQDIPTLDRRRYERRAWIGRVPQPRLWQRGTIAPPQGIPLELHQRYWKSAESL